MCVQLLANLTVLSVTQIVHAIFIYNALFQLSMAIKQHPHKKNQKQQLKKFFSFQFYARTCTQIQE